MMAGPRSPGWRAGGLDLPGGEHRQRAAGRLDGDRQPVDGPEWAAPGSRCSSLDRWSSASGGGRAEPGQYENLGTVSATSLAGTVVEDEDLSHYFGIQGDIEVEKSTNGEDADAAPGPFIPLGDPVTGLMR